MISLETTLVNFLLYLDGDNFGQIRRVDTIIWTGEIHFAILHSWNRFDQLSTVGNYTSQISHYTDPYGSLLVNIRIPIKPI